MLTSLYVDGDTPFHRLSARFKLAVLMVAGIATFFIGTLWILVPLFVVSLGLYATIGLRFGQALGRIRWVAFTVFVLALATWLFDGLHEALALTFRLMALVLFAAAVTATTTIDAFMDEITRLLRPLDRLGLVRAADISLALGLVLRFVPQIGARYHAIREAHQARGLPVRPSSLFVPLIILTLKDADTIAMAIDARSFRRGDGGQR